LLMVAVLYPYVYLLTRATFASQAPSLTEAGRTLGLSPGQAFFRVSLPLARPAIAAGIALACMETLADYGTVAYFGLPTFTTGILNVMDREELQGVAAHELAHVANRDTLVMAVAATTAGVIAIISDIAIRMSWFTGGNRRDNNDGGNAIGAIVGLVAVILAPIAALLLRSAISRKRESLADATAVAFTRNPTGLRRALETLAADSTVVEQKSNAVAHIWIESPLDASATSKMFATHPPIEQRIALLRQMEGSGPVT
ncbi:MAG: ABC transporter permease subunit, partial [Actinobacteria bacterium]|nr:ABC transporter permease subunit [Actinomycetota bacterium]